MLKIYCEDGATTKEIRKLGKKENIVLVSFPFENYNRRTTNAKKPSNLTWDSDLWTWDTDILFSDMEHSEIFTQLEKIIGPQNFNDIRHVDTAFKEKCQIFISPDKKDIINNSHALESVTGIKFFYCEDLKGINNFINSL